IASGDAFGEHSAIDPGGGGDVLKRAIAPIEKKLERLSLIADKQIEPAIIIYIDPYCRLGAGGFTQAARDGDIGESPVAIFPQQRFPLVKLIGSTQHQDVKAAVIVVIGLQNVQAARLIRESGFAGLVDKCSVAVVVKKMHRAATFETGRNHVE